MNDLACDNFRKAVLALRGFTLIELLIVVAILTIISGLAVQNYVEAQTRAKIARNIADFHVLATAIEAYSVDHNAPPRMAHWKFYGDSQFDEVRGERVGGVLSVVLSTPIAYVTNPHLLDPFMERNLAAPLDERIYTYQDITTYIAKNPSSSFWLHASDYYGAWRLGAVGPDQRFDHGFSNSAQLPYDPTNGSISLGNVWFSQRRTEIQALPPVPELLGAH